MSKANIIGGAGANKRSDLDFYSTPPEVTQALLDFLKLPAGQIIWEPACGDGDMVKVLQQNGHYAVATDIRYGMDFLADETVPGGEDWIITNPPFSLAEQFIRKAASFQKPFAMLLKSTYWSAARRLKLFREIPPSCVLPLTWRPDFQWKKRGEGERGAPMMDVMWCVWYSLDPIKTIYCPLEKPKGDGR